MQGPGAVHFPGRVARARGHGVTNQAIPDSERGRELVHAHVRLCVPCEREAVTFYSKVLVCESEVVGPVCDCN